MKKLTLREVQQKLIQVEELVNREGEIAITRRGKVVARLLPAQSRSAPPSHADLRARMPRLQTPSETLVRMDRDGR
jgi:antitoxin (DNA-binding transcriptional repressor) of toxin-antitoxin stability system